MAIGVISYGDLVDSGNFGGIGNLTAGYDNMRSFIDKNRVKNKMKESQGSLAEALSSGNFGEASRIAMNAGDIDMANKYADLYDKQQQRAESVAYNNARLGLERQKLNAELGKYAIKRQLDAEKKTRSLLAMNDSADKIEQIINENPSLNTRVDLNTNRIFSGGNSNAKWAEVVQYATDINNMITADAREGGNSATMMNSDKEGERAMGILANPAGHTAREVLSAVKIARNRLNFKNNVNYTSPNASSKVDLNAVFNSIK